MKICWDNLENVYISIHGNLKIGKRVIIEKTSCKQCGEPYLTRNKHANFCRVKCANIGRDVSSDRLYTSETRKRMSEKASSRVGSLSPNYKGGVVISGFTVYTTYKDRLLPYENIRKKKDTKFLEVTCAYCGQWYMPKRVEIVNRLNAINNFGQGELRLYCSENCKQSCPTYNQSKYPKDFKKATSREVSTYLRQVVFERDNWECQKCGKTIKEAPLHCHHIKGYTQNKILANDIDNCITLCKECHKFVHMQHGCRYIDLRCKRG